VWDASELVLRLKGGYSSQVTQMGTAGNDTITGTAGDDVIDGGAGDDFLSGVSGSDLYLFYAGAGHDTVREGGIFVGSKRGWGEVDGIKLVGLAPADVTFSRLGDDLFVRVNATGDTLTVQGHFEGEAFGMERVLFSDGTVWTRDQIAENAPIRGTDGADFLSGRVFSSFPDVFDDDKNVFAGGRGNDTLEGGIGDDTYLWSPGDGNDEIIEFSRPGETDTLRLHGVDPADVQLVWRNSNLLIGIGDETITIDSQEFGMEPFELGEGIEQIVFDGGTIWNEAYIFQHARFVGTDGNDFIVGTSGDDRIVGGLGNDRLLGQAGSDTYVYASGDGNDTIQENSVQPTSTRSNSSICCRPTSRLRSTRDGTLLVDVNATGDEIAVAGEFAFDLFGGSDFSPTDGIEQIRFADGTAWDRQQIKAAAGTPVISGTDNGDLLFGDDGNNTIKGLGGADLIFGAGGEDLIDGGDGNDAIIGGKGDDRLFGGGRIGYLLLRFGRRQRHHPREFRRSRHRQRSISSTCCPPTLRFRLTAMALSWSTSTRPATRSPS